MALCATDAHIGHPFPAPLVPRNGRPRETLDLQKLLVAVDFAEERNALFRRRRCGRTALPLRAGVLDRLAALELSWFGEAPHKAEKAEGKDAQECAQGACLDDLDHSFLRSSWRQFSMRKEENSSSHYIMTDSCPYFRPVVGSLNLEAK